MQRTSTLGPPQIGRGVLAGAPERMFWRGSQFFGSDWLRLDREGDQGNSELQGYDPANVFLTGALLEIKSEVASSHGHAYRSGDIQWSPSFGGVTYGTFEVRAKFCGGTGLWPAIWLLGTGCETTDITSADNSGTCQWPNRSDNSSEIDWIELLGNNRTTLNCVIHTDAQQGQGGTSSSFSDCSTNWHVYQLVWSPGSLVWKVDGTTVSTLSSSNVPAHPMFLKMNTAVGGIGGGSVNDSTLPQSTLIDYVRVTSL